MGQLLEILGRGLATPIPDLIWQYLKVGSEEAMPEATAGDERLEKVLALVAAKKHDSALSEVTRYVELNGDSSRGRLAAAALYLVDNRLDAAREHLDAIYRSKPSNMMALYALGHCCERSRREDEAVAFYQDCLKFRNYLELPRQRLAAIHFKNGQMARTIAEYENLVKEYPEDMVTLVTLGYLYIAAGDYEKAQERFSTAILIQPDNFAIEDAIVDNSADAEYLHEALDNADQILAEDPQRVDIILQQGDILARLGAETEAIEKYACAIDLCPDYLTANIKLGASYLRSANSELAARQFNRAMDINDRLVDAYTGLATAQKLSENVDEALVTLSLAAAIDANGPLLFAQTAALHFQGICEPEEAAARTLRIPQAVITAHCTQLSRQGDDPDVNYRLGLLLASAGRLNEAIELYRKSVDINPTFVRARNKLAVALYDADEHALALEELTTPACLDQQTLNLHYEIALLYCDQIKFASSLLNLQKKIEDSFTAAEVTFNISLALQNLGLLDRADITWQSLSDMAKAAST